MGKVHIGIDPGLDGAMACILPRDDLVVIYDTPTLTIAGKSGKKREYDLDKIRGRLTAYPTCYAAIELIHSMPGQGVRSMFSMGYGLGIWEGMLKALCIPLERVTPQRWKKAMLDGMGHDKDASRFKAMQLFPKCAAMLSRQKDHGRAEALLIAEYLRRTRK